LIGRTHLKTAVSTNELLQLILKRLDTFETRLDKIETRLDAIETRLTRVEMRLEIVEERVQLLGEKVEAQSEEIRAMRSQMEVLGQDTLRVRGDQRLLNIRVTDLEAERAERQAA
jgi:archaellum component FlaC